MSDYQAFIHTHEVRPDGRKDCFLTQRAECRYAPLPHHLAGLTWTASGYGKRIPMRYMVRFRGRWRRVYYCGYGNAGTAYIGKLADRITVQIET